MRILAVLGLLPCLFAPLTAFAEEALWVEGHHAPPPASATRTDFVKLAESLGPSVVYITGRIGHSGPLARRGESDSGGKSVGTGFLIHKSGYLLTNSHVIEKAEEIRVKLADGRDFLAQVVGADEKTDIALLKISAPQPLPAAPLGDSDRLRVGEWVVAIGNPYGEFERSVTAGIISAISRNNVKPAGREELYANFIQTDAAINLGNSGGPLIGANGEVVGIASAIYRRPGTPDFHDAQNISFAIPINMAKALIPLLKKHGRAPRSWLGIDIQPVGVYLSRAFKLAQAQGALVADVREGSPASRAGLKSGDVIIEFNGKRISNSNDLPWFASITPAGDRVSLTLIREGAEKRLHVVMVKHPEEQASGSSRRAAAAVTHGGDPLGLIVADAPTGGRGVLVTELQQGSTAVEAGVERDDLILRVGSTAIGNLADYRRAIERIPAGSVVLMQIRRGEKPFWVAFPRP